MARYRKGETDKGPSFGIPGVFAVGEKGGGGKKKGKEQANSDVSSLECKREKKKERKERLIPFGIAAMNINRPETRGRKKRGRGKGGMSATFAAQKKRKEKRKGGRKRAL